MSNHLPQQLPQVEWDALPDVHKEPLCEWMREHGYAEGEYWFSEDGPPKTRLILDATALLHWLDERLGAECNVGVTRYSDWWEAHWIADDGAMTCEAGPSPVAALWAAVLRVLEVTP